MRRQSYSTKYAIHPIEVQENLCDARIRRQLRWRVGKGGWGEEFVMRKYCLLAEQSAASNISMLGALGAALLCKIIEESVGDLKSFMVLLRNRSRD